MASRRWRRYVEEHPLSLALEQDVVRGLLGGWRTRETASGQLARELCLALARTHLLGGRDVIVPQFVAVAGYLDQLRTVATETGSAHVELLLDDADAAERRFHARVHDPLWAEHQRVAAEFIAQAGGYRDQYDRMLRAVEGRQVGVITSVEDAVEGTYAELLSALAV